METAWLAEVHLFAKGAKGDTVGDIWAESNISRWAAVWCQGCWHRGEMSGLKGHPFLKEKRTGRLDPLYASQMVQDKNVMLHFLLLLLGAWAFFFRGQTIFPVIIYMLLKQHFK